MKLRRKRKLKRRKAGAAPGRVVSDAVIRLMEKAFIDWLWQAYRERGRSVGDLGAEVGLSRQGFEKLLRRRGKRTQFGTFLRVCFLRPDCEQGFVVVAEGWNIQARWVMERSNSSCVSHGNGAA